MNVLAGDVGGTSTRLAIMDASDRAMRVLHKHKFNNQDFTGLAPIVRTFLAEIDELPCRACFGVACPVSDGCCTMTNLPWTIDAGSLAAEIGVAGTIVINDLVAAGYGVQSLTPQDVVPLQSGAVDLSDVPATKGLIGAGTGLGAAYLTWNGDRHTVHPSEGGHATFAARNAEEWELVRFLMTQFGDVSCERVVSGPGLVNVYRYLREAAHGGGDHDPEATDITEDSAPLITKRGLDGEDQLAARALDIFTAAYGAKAGDFALTVMATGGIYLTGGIAPQIVSKLADGTFISAFLDKGRLAAVLARIPVHVIVNPDVGLMGAGMLAARQ